MTAAVSDQVRAGLDVITDGEQARFDFNLSFYARTSRGSSSRSDHGGDSVRPPTTSVGVTASSASSGAPRGLGVVEDFERLRELAPAGPVLKAAVPARTHSRVASSRQAHTPIGGRWPRHSSALSRRSSSAWWLPAARSSPSTSPMSCYAYREDTARLVDLFSRTVEPIVGRCYLGTHLCFGNYKGRAASKRRYAPMFLPFSGSPSTSSIWRWPAVSSPSSS